jgi:hypothetical protein
VRPGGGKQKGSAFERQICSKLSLWITNGKRDDCMWRSAISGGRATVRFKKGKSTHDQSGDLTATSREAMPFLNTFMVECKHVADLNIQSALVKGVGIMAGFWTKLDKQADDHGKLPLLIGKENNWPVLVFMLPGSVRYFGSSLLSLGTMTKLGVVIYALDDLLKGSYAAHRFRTPAEKELIANAAMH